jgi:dihydrolipoamide dehydrogenase
MAESFDVIVVGAGPAGYVAAIRAAQLGLRTAIVDRQWLGGVCLNVGCIPSKALLRNAEIAHLLRERGKEFGFSFDNLTLDYSSAVKRSRLVSDRLVKGVGFLMKKNNIPVYIGSANLSGDVSNTLKSISITDLDGKHTNLSAKNIIIATGASAIIPANWKMDGTRVVTYKEAILQEKIPSSVVIIGAGAIGMEFATVWSSYGVDVTVVEMLPHILPLEDSEAAAEVAKAYTKRGVKLLPGHKVEAVEMTKNGVKVTVSIEGASKVLEAEQALLAIGFRPNSKELGLEETGVRINERGFIEIDTKMSTNIPGIWAVGDVTGKLMLAHVGSAMGIVCAENIAGHETVILDYEMMPRATYCQPQVASFGMTEEQAKERGYKIKIGRFPFQANGKALGMGDYAGWVKLVVNEEYGEILGATLVGPEVTELLPELTLARMLELTPEEIARNVHAHPTLSEALMEAAHAAQGNAIHI